MNLRKMPIGVQDFETIRTEGFVYVDKTALVYHLANEGTQCFLGRPRRFGKSLLQSTLKYYFQGKKELFEGLAIAELEQDWPVHPVFHIDLGGGRYNSLEGLDSELASNLRPLEEQWGRDPEEDTPGVRLKGLLRRACAKSGKKVVVLIDEYDKPLVQNLDKPELLEELRMALAGFYGIIKGSGQYIRFVLLTGVTKFSKVNVFSDLNQLEDISMDKIYADICGLSAQELVDNFKPELEALAEENHLSYDEALAKMQRLYNGYHFVPGAEGMFNPFGVLNTLKKHKFGYYWFETGTPSILLKEIKNNHIDLLEYTRDVTIMEFSLTDYRANGGNPIPLLYQSGYLTIKDYDSQKGKYVLGFPNEEVEYGFLEELLRVYLPPVLESQGFYVGKFIEDLDKGDIEKFLTRLRALFYSIPYPVKEQSEYHYQSLFYLVVRLMGQFAQAELQCARGRADVVVTMTDAVYCFEFKLSGNGTAMEALTQIDDKGYLIPFTAGGKKLVKAGVVFDNEKHTLGEWTIGCYSG
ncbi:ATPase AAA [Spirochaetia bacterium]|nr:ATPase AAA [Spirochaetia bacterium]